ncbi:MAG: methyltransferase domain-containing protein [Dehalococcoidia bacterium]
MNQTDQWNPDQYNKFRDQRMLPFFDLAGFLRPVAGARIIDRGCGAGELTAMLAERFADATVEGIDSSTAMLERAAPRGHHRLSFRRQDVRAVEDFGAFDIVFSNAVLQWVPGNDALLERILREAKPGAQVAIQVPKNFNHASHRTAREVAGEPPFRDLLADTVPIHHVFDLELAAAMLYRYGFEDATCIEKIYGHELKQSSDVVEWVKGTSLSAYLTRLDEATGARFLDTYRTRLLAVIGEHSPYFYPFRRLLLWGQKR